MNTNSVRLIIRAAFIFIVFLIGFAFVTLSPAKGQKPSGFSFVQVSDTHVGFSDPKVNPDHEGTLAKIIASINALSPQPDFVVFTGDLTHTTDEAVERRARMKRFADIAGQLSVKDVRYLPGEHDAALDSGEAFKAMFGPTHYAFTHQGINFIAIDNVSDPISSVGAAQLAWLAAVTKKLPKNARVVILTHRPLFDLYPQWDWWTRDSAQVRAVFKKFDHVLALYGHIHQFNQATVDNIEFVSARGAMYPLPAPGSQPKKAPVPWNADTPYSGLGFRKIEVKTDPPQFILTEYSVFGTPETPAAPVIKVTAKKFEFSPSTIVLKKGVLTELDLTSLDVRHGFNCPDLNIRADVLPGSVAVVKVQPAKTGTFPFFCDVFCGVGHGDMTGKIEVTE